MGHTRLSSERVEDYLEVVRDTLFRLLSLPSLTHTVSFERSYAAVYHLTVHKYHLEVHQVLREMVLAYVPLIGSPTRLAHATHSLESIFKFYDMRDPVLRTNEIVAKYRRGAWHRLRRLSPYLVWVSRLYEEVSLRPQHSGVRRVRAHFEANVQRVGCKRERER